MAELHEVKPREQAGRDTLERYNAQIRAASIACLSILEGKDVKRVFANFTMILSLKKSLLVIFVTHLYKSKLRRNCEKFGNYETCLGF